MRALLRPLAVLVGLAGLALPAVAQGEALDAALDGVPRAPNGVPLAFVRASAEPEATFAGALVRVRLQVGIERELLRAGLVPLFQRPLDLPAQLEAPWFQDLRPAPERAGGARRTLAVGESVAEAAEVGAEARDGLEFRVFELERLLVPRRPGDLELAAPRLRLACATRFEEGLLHGRVPLDRREVRVRGEPLRLRVEPLPEAGRPPEFAGAVGRFTLRAEAAPRDVALGASLRLVVHVEGEGDLGAFEAPRLAAPGFRELGRIDAVGAAERTLSFDLAPTRSDLRAVPAVELVYFDPTPPGEYRVARSEEIAITVRAAPPPGPAERGPAPAPQPGAGFAAAGSVIVLLVVAGLAVAAGIVGLVLLVRAAARRSR